MPHSFEKAVKLAREGRWDQLDQALYELPALASSQDESGRTLLMICASLGGSSSLIRKLVGLGSNPNHQAYDGSTALAAAIAAGSRYGLSTVPELRTLIELGADPNMVADSGMPALHWAIAQHRPEHVEALLEQGVDVDCLTSDSPPESGEDIARRLHLTKELRMLTNHRKRKMSRIR